ncbi:Large-conductance mechanosensitive channel [Urinicoccus massiliensis]|uniref:Large-conductance mechanosensitive channel n=1 Tax=Urinicoccus massiliensis TaxID=1723382 RepID=A0A8H2M5K2_9FIRM|nr:large conductance mechanosensitive channel protein MscL [Urinicoccus massiliensis]VFB16819.1 Large-conductance mechanosensitive channel [Urinicoccus massiliensis]
MKKTLQEFKDFIAQGNVIDMAIGVIIGGAFGKIVASLVDDVIMPLVGLIIGGIDFSSLYIALDGKSYPNIAAAKEATAVLAYGSFIQNIVNFLIIAFVIFITLKKILAAPKLFKKEEVAEPTTKTCPYCLSEVPLKASRCPHCTSQLKDEKSHEA